MILDISIAIVIIGIIFSSIRLLIGPEVWDRLNSLSLISVKMILFLSLLSTKIENELLLDAAIIYTIIGFLGIILFTRFIDRGNMND